MWKSSFRQRSHRLVTTIASMMTAIPTWAIRRFRARDNDRRWALVGGEVLEAMHGSMEIMGQNEAAQLRIAMVYRSVSAFSVRDGEQIEVDAAQVFQIA